MRIDYFIVSEKLKEKIVACEMHGQGIELQGKFLFLY
jgi:exonuclease III